jgi:hypothetical protein
MAAGPALVLMALCEVCWLDEHARWQPESMDETGNITMRFVGADVPDKVNTGTVEICCECGGITVCGIYEYKDPSKVWFTSSGESPEFEFGLDHDIGDDLL